MQPAEKVNRYAKSVIYKLEHQTKPELIYVGGTTNFSARKAQHKSRTLNPNDKEHNGHKYKMIRENGGWEAFRMVPIKEFCCKSKLELEIEEEKVREEHKARLNAQRAFNPARIDGYTESEESLKARAERLKKYREEHADEIAAYKNTKPFLSIKKKKYKPEDFKG
jgi:hypothetical protein